MYLAKLCDRHVDDQYVVSDSKEKAIEKCKEWIEEYESQYEWIVPNWNWQPYLEYVMETTCEDGPRVSVETVDRI